MAGAFGESLTGAAYHRYLRIQIAHKMGWTLDHIDSLPLEDWLDTIAVIGALADLEEFRLRG